MLVIGHRGARARAPENTVAAFEAALADGADGIEFDVLLTADGIPVISHDDDLRRTCGIDLRLSDLTLDEVRALDVAATTPGWSGSEPMPTLGEIVERFHGRTRLFVELKANIDLDRGFRPASLVAERALPLLQGLQGIVVSSFDPSGPAYIHEHSSLPVAIAVAAAASCTTYGTSARALGCAQVHLEASMVDRESIQAASALGLEVLAWTVNDAAGAARFAALGVAGVFSDDPAAALAVS